MLASEYGCSFVDTDAGTLDIDLMIQTWKTNVADLSSELDEIDFPWEYHFSSRLFSSISDHNSVLDTALSTGEYPLPQVDEVLPGIQIGSQQDIDFMNEFLATL